MGMSESSIRANAVLVFDAWFVRRREALVARMGAAGAVDVCNAIARAIGHAASVDLASLAAGFAIGALERVISGEVDSAVAVDAVEKLASFGLGALRDSGYFG